MTKKSVNSVVNSARFERSVYLLLALVVALCIALYFPGLEGGYLFDDEHVLKNNINLRMQSLSFYNLLAAADSFVAGGRQLSMLSFALNYYLFGESIWWLKMVNLIIHCGNGAALFLLCRMLLNRSTMATVSNAANADKRCHSSLLPLIVSAAWLLHPLNLTSVLYLSQRMALLSALFVLSGLICHVWAREGFKSKTRTAVYVPLNLLIFGVLGYKCKENAILLPLYAFVLEWCLFQFTVNKQRDSVLVSVFGAGAAVAVFFIGYQFWQNPQWIVHGYSTRTFSLVERVLTEFRVLVYYISQIVVPLNSELTLWHDDFSKSLGWLSPKTTLWSFGFLAGLFTLAVLSIKKCPLFSLGVFWFFVSHSIESTVFPLELIHEHRNYLASAGILLAVTGLLAQFLARRQGLFMLICVVAVTAFGGVLHERAHIWSDEWTQVQHEAHYHPESAASLFKLGQLYLHQAKAGDETAQVQARAQAIKYLERASAADQFTIMPEIILIIYSHSGSWHLKPEWQRSALKKLENYPHMATSKGALQWYYHCLKQNKCGQDYRFSDRLFRVAVNSRSADLKNTGALYFDRIRDKNNIAESAFRQSLSRSTVISWTNYLEFLLHIEKKPLACREFNEFIKLLEQQVFRDVLVHLASVNRVRFLLQDCPETL